MKDRQYIVEERQYIVEERQYIVEERQYIVEDRQYIVEDRQYIVEDRQYIGGQTIHWPRDNNKRTNNNLQNITQKTRLSNTNPTKTGVELKLTPVVLLLLSTR